jgi:uncharacterized protein YfaS (alpha-2-macroglobulin family)
MKSLRLFISLQLIALTFAIASPAVAAPKLQEVTGTVMAAETNKPVAGAEVTFFSQSDKGVMSTKSSAQSITGIDGRYAVKLPPGTHSWFVKAEGFGILQGGNMAADKPYQLPVVYLRKPAELSGRIVDGNGKPLAGVIIAADKLISATSGSDGRFIFSNLSPQGYEPSLRKPGWVLEKNEYHHLSPGEKKELGDLVIRKSATLKVLVTVRDKGKHRQLENIRVNLNGNAIYRSAKADKKGFTLLNELPPGRYTVTVTDERLKDARKELEINEGDNRELSLEVEVKPPTLGIEEYNDVFLPDKPVKLRANSMWVDRAEAIISRISAATLLDGSVDLRKPDGIPIGSLKQVTRIPVDFKARRDSHSRYGRFSLPGLTAGGYLLELKGNGATARFSFLVTRLGLVVKTSPGGTLVFATDLITGSRLNGIEISSLPRSSSVVTDKDGLANWSLATAANRLAGRNGDNLAFLDLPQRDSSSKGAAHKGYIYTDRPVYRPGQTVYFKGVMRQRDGEGYRLPALDNVVVSIKDDNDKAVCDFTLTVSANGSFNGECTLPKVPALGDYSISASGKSEIWSGVFKVLEYRKPEFEVKTTADRAFLVAGDTGQIKVTARYYFGAPVANGKLVWRIYSKPAWGMGASDSDDDGNEDEGRFGGGYADFIGEGEAKLDENGEADVPVVAKLHDMPFTYTLEADVTDASSRQVSASGSLNVVPSLVSLNIKSANYLTRPGTPQDISIKAATWEGAPQSLPLRLSFGRQIYDKKSRSYNWLETESRGITTLSDGSARTSFSFPSPGYWQVKVDGADEAGRKTTASSPVWVWKDGFSWEGSYRELEAEFDRNSYKPGQTARLIVRTPLTGGSMLLTLEGRDISNRRIVPLNGMVEVIEIPVTETMAPYIHVSAITVGGGRFFSRTLPLKVDFQPDRLELKVTPDKPVYAPGDPVRLTVSSNRDGKPVPAELSLGIVDESIYAIAKERSDDIWKFFRGSREHLVNTLHSFPRVYLGGASKEKSNATKEDDGLKGLKIRKVFKDTAAWFPMLETKPDGSTVAEFTLPDNLTTWRATAMGHTPASQFGVGREKFIARLELMARLAPPRFLVVDDELNVPGVITSVINREQAITGRFEVNGLTLLGNPTFSGSIAPRGSLRTNVWMRAEKSGTASLRLLAKGNDKGDAMELALPVLPRSISREIATGIALRDTEATTELKLPTEALGGTAHIKLSFAPTIAASLNSAINRLVEFPYGCVEQTLSRFIPAVHARSLLNKSGWKPDPATEAKLPLVIAEGIRRLEEMQHEDGGWGWWKNDSSSLTMTAHSVYGLGLAKRAGLEIPDNLLNRGIALLEKQAASALSDDLPRAYRALSVNGIRNEILEKRIVSLWKTMPLSGRLTYGEALAYNNRKQELVPVINQIKLEIQNEGPTAYVKDSEAESWWYGWRWGSSVVETTSTMLSLLVSQDAADPLTPQLAGFLARRQEGGWWRTTSASANAITALADYVAASGETTSSYTAKMRLNNNEYASWRVENGRLSSGDASITIPADKLKAGANQLTLTKDGPGAAYLAAALEYQAAPEAARSTTGLDLERTLYKMSTTKSGSSWRREYTQLKPGDTIKPGDDIEVRLVVENRRNLDYVIIEDRLPAGFESRETDRDPRFSDESSYQGWYSHQERRDEKLVFFITSLPAGRHEFRHVLYPEIEGRMIALPAAAWPMYQPELRGESAPWQHEVKGH